MPLHYEVDDWGVVFPLGIYTVGTYELARALRLAGFPAGDTGDRVYVSLLVWVAVAGGALLCGYRGFRVGGRRHPLR